MPTILDAENDLKLRLEESFGSELHGVLTYGRRWDPGTRTQLLRVVYDASVPEARVMNLPRQIQGFPVKVSRAGPVEL